MQPRDRLPMVTFRLPVSASLFVAAMLVFAPAAHAFADSGAAQNGTDESGTDESGTGESGRGEGGGVFSEARIGLAAHGLDLNGGEPSPEGGVNVSAELLFKSPGVFRYILQPRPFVHGSLNSRGDTSFYGVGLAWEQHVFQDRAFGEIDFGVARHDGVIDLPPPDDPAFAETAASRNLLGARYLFRVSVGVGYRISERWRVQAFYEHLSNGQILNGDSTDRNQGLDNVGVRIGYRFGG